MICKNNVLHPLFSAVKLNLFLKLCNFCSFFLTKTDVFQHKKQKNYTFALYLYPVSILIL